MGVSNASSTGRRSANFACLTAPADRIANAQAENAVATLALEVLSPNDVSQTLTRLGPHLCPAKDEKYPPKGRYFTAYAVPDSKKPRIVPGLMSLMHFVAGSPFRRPPSRHHLACGQEKQVG